MINRRSIPAILLASFLMFISGGLSAAVDTSTVIITNVPEPKEVITEPAGYISCTTEEAGWTANGTWHPAYRVCQYNKTNVLGETWIAGHWVCNQYTATTGACTKWDWEAGRWVQSVQTTTP